MNTKHWLDHFKQNSWNELRWTHDPEKIPPHEINRITQSIQAFQLGEASEGRTLQKMARHWSRTHGPREYADAIAYLIREENRHSEYLGRFMSEHGIPKVTKRGSDSVFRFIRAFMGIELSVRTLVTAELVALTYYDCLARSTSSPTLPVICARMLEEEQIHIAFQMHHIHLMNAPKQPALRWLADFGHAVLTAGTLAVVWFEHGRVMRPHYGFRGYARKVWRDFQTTRKEGRRSASDRPPHSSGVFTPPRNFLPSTTPTPAAKPADYQAAPILRS